MSCSVGHLKKKMRQYTFLWYSLSPKPDLESATPEGEWGEGEGEAQGRLFSIAFKNLLVIKCQWL